MTKTSKSTALLAVSLAVQAVFLRFGFAPP